MQSTKICSVFGCERVDRITRGLCATHYTRLRLKGDPGGPEIALKRYPSGAMCSAPECDGRSLANGLCRAHYKRMRRYGTLELPKASTLVEYMSKRTRVAAAPSDRPGLGACHEWTGTISVKGYGFVRHSGSLGGDYRTRLAHRVAFELAHGQINQDDVIDHLCRNRKCVNPDHLEQVSNEENLRRGLGYRLRNGMSSSCVNGHPYTEENTYRNPNNPSDTRCRECARERNRKRAKNGRRNISNHRRQSDR